MLGNNATVLPLRDFRSARRTLYFTRPELNQLLGLYSRNVARGIWRDYAIDHRDGQALFSVFRHTHESAVYTIVKSVGQNQATGRPQFTVLSGRQRLRAAKTLAEALDYFARNWRWSRPRKVRRTTRQSPPCLRREGNSLSREGHLDLAERAVIGADLYARVGEHHAGVGPGRDEGAGRHAAALLATWLTRSTRSPIGSPARSPVQSAKCLPSAVTSIGGWTRSIPCQPEAAAP